MSASDDWGKFKNSIGFGEAYDTSTNGFGKAYEHTESGRTLLGRLVTKVRDILGL